MWWNPDTATLAMKMMKCQTVDEKASEAFVAYIFKLGSPPYNIPGGPQLEIPDGLAMPTIGGRLPRSFKERFRAFPEDKLQVGPELQSAYNKVAGLIAQRPRSVQDFNKAATDADGDVAMIQDFSPFGMPPEPAVWPSTRTRASPFGDVRLVPQEWGSISTYGNKGKDYEMPPEPVVGPEGTPLPGASSKRPVPSTPSVCPQPQTDSASIACPPGWRAD